MAEIYRLTCFVWGSSAPIQVKIPSDETVYELKKCIKKEKENMLAHVDADELTLYQIDITGTQKEKMQQIQEKVLNLKLSDALDSEDILSEKYRSAPPPTKATHILVIVPEIQSTVMARDRSSGSRSGAPMLVDKAPGGGTLPNPPIYLPLQHTESKLPEDLDSDIKEFLDDRRPQMRRLVEKANNPSSLLPTWEGGVEELAQHISKLRIPRTSRGRPSLLLHELGGIEELDSDIIERISDIFSSEDHIILVNTSGSGKTWLLLQGLCLLWGFYFVAEPDSSGIGSKDLEQIMKELDQARDYGRAKGEALMSETQTQTQAFAHMREVARCRLAQALLARFLLLNLFVEEARKLPGGLQEKEHRRLWVLLQAQPQIFDTTKEGEDTTKKGEDIFTRLTRFLRQSDLADLEARIRNQCDALADLNQKIVNPASGKLQTPPFFCVLDEVQATVNLRRGEFKSDDNPTSRPVLRPILREIWLLWTKVLESTQMRVILSGTGIDTQALEVTLSSTACKLLGRRTVHNTGAFEDPKSQATYIKRYIKAPFDDNQRWMDFLNRAWDWTRGRYRFTATLIYLLLEAGYHCPHRTIDEYVKALTDFEPTDGKDWVDDEPQLPGKYLSGFSNMVGRVANFEKMSEMQAGILCDAIYDQTLYGRYTLKSFSKQANQAFVEYGVARHRPRELVMDEPLAILAAFHWLNQQAKLSMFNCLRRDIHNHSPRKNGFEAYLAFYMRSVFENGRKLDAIFTFRDDFARRNDLTWRGDEFELVTVVRTADSDEPRIFVVEPSCGPPPNVGFLAQSAEDVLGWMSANNGGFTFCFPPNNFGPDLLFFVRSKESGKLLLVVVQAKNYDSVDKETLIKGVRTVTPSWFWKSKDKKHATAKDAPFLGKDYESVANKAQEILTNMPLGLKMRDADYPILRVFASWPGEAKLDRSHDQKKATKARDKAKDDDPDKHPLASLNLENFTKFSEDLDSNWLRADIKQNLLKRTHREEDDLLEHLLKRQKSETRE